MQNKEQALGYHAFPARLPVKKLFTACLCILLVFPGLAQNSRIPFSKIGPLSLDSGTAWVQPVFDASIGDNIQVVGLGEVSHGVYEPLAFKAKMVQYLVTKRGYRQLLLELSDIGTVRPIRLYLLDNNIKDLSVIDSLVAGMSVMPSAAAIYRELFRWLKQYNLLHPREMVQIMGFDLNLDAVFLNYFMYNYLIPYDNVRAHQLLSHWGRGDIGDSTKMASLYTWYLDHKSKLSKDLSKAEFGYLERQIQLNRYSIQDFILKSNGEFLKANIYRDSILANNVTNLSGTQKTIVWAHNSHIYAGGQYMGMYLNRYYGEKYYVLMTDFSGKAKVYVADKSKTILDDGYFQLLSFQSNKGSLANLISHYYGVSAGIFLRRDLAGHKQKTGDRINTIDNYGEHFLIGDGRSIDALVIFENIHSDPLK